MSKISAVGQGAAGTAALPFGGVFSSDANVGIIVREIKVFTTAANAARINIHYATTAGTWTNALVEKQLNKDGGAVTGAAFSAASAAPTFDTDPLDVGAVGAAIGSGFHYTYYGEGGGIFIPKGTANGIILIEEADTANTYDFAFIWEPA